MIATGGGDAEGVRRVMRLIHGALLGGILMFGVVVLFLLRGGDMGSGQSGPFRWVWLALALVALFAAGLVRGRLRPEAPAREVQTTAIVIWALAEAQALAGLSFALVTGDMLLAGGGLVVAMFLLALHRPASF
jgi:hypothetical protein